MKLKRIISALTAAITAFTAFGGVAVRADDELSPIPCTQSAAYLKNNGNPTLVLNTADKQTPENIVWNTNSGDWKGIGVLEFDLPALDASLLKSAELSYTIHNGSSRSGGRTYTVYGADITIDENTTVDVLSNIAVGTANALYNGAAVAQGETRTDTIPSEALKEYVKSKAKADEGAKLQLAFSNSSQVLDIAPTSASLKITLYGGGIALDKHELTLLTDSEGAELAVNIFEQGVDASTLVWASSNEKVAKLEGNKVVPVSAGTAKISVKTPDNSFSDECEVTVNQAVESIALDKSTLSLKAGCESGELVVKYAPDNAVNRDVEWTSSNENIAKVSQNGIITPVSAGTAKITAKIKDREIAAECEVTVAETAELESLALDKESISLPKLGATAVLHTAVTPENADSRVSWTSSNESVAKVYEGVVVSENVGEAVITATSANGKSAECKVTVTEDKQLITNDRFYTDTDGNTLYSQGGGIFKFGDTYYWYGVRYAESVTYAADPTGATRNVEHPAFEAYTCYTSKDLVNWEYKGDVANLASLGESWCGWAGRCGVVYNEKANKYVLVSQFNGTIIASADNPLGPFKKEKSYFWFDSEKLPIANNDTGDLTMFWDEDGSAYMICSSANGRDHLYVIPMRESDYCDIDKDRIKELGGSTGSYYDEDGSVKKKDKGGIEGDCMFKYRGRYYFTGSDLYGWHGSRCYVFQSDSILGAYSEKPDYITATGGTNLPYIMPGVKNSYAHNSQTGFYYTLKGTEQDLVIYCGDRWSSFCSNGLGYNQWVPLTMDGYTPHFNNLSQWRLLGDTGKWEIGDGNNYVENSYFDADRVDVTKLTGWECSDNIGGGANGNVKDKLRSGKYSARQSADKDYIATMKQQLSDLPDGTYTLRALARSSGGQNESKIYVKTADGEYSTSLKAPMSTWTDVVIKDIEIKDGKCEVGIYSDAKAGNYIRVDDIFLTRNYDGTVIEGKANTNVPELYETDGVELTARFGEDGRFESVTSRAVKAGDTVKKSENAKVKVFAWDALDRMKPIVQ